MEEKNKQILVNAVLVNHRRRCCKSDTHTLTAKTVKKLINFHCHSDYWGNIVYYSSFRSSSSSFSSLSASRHNVLTAIRVNCVLS